MSQGHALLAEILQLTSSLPPALQPSATKYAPILFDFRYFRDPDAHDQKIETSRELASLDEEFREVRLCISMRPRHACILRNVSTYALYPWVAVLM